MQKNTNMAKHSQKKKKWTDDEVELWFKVALWILSRISICNVACVPRALNTGAVQHLIGLGRLTIVSGRVELLL